jgi:cholesterol oxidase
VTGAGGRVAPAPAAFDVAVVGSGFGGSVAALRLSEKGYRVAVLEAGRRFAPEDLPRSSWDVRRFLWAPGLRCFGIQRAHFLRHVIVLAGAGVGGGSLNYANTLYRPLPEFYRDPQWATMADWEAELAPYFDQAARMLGVVDNPLFTPADEAMRAVATEMGVAGTFRPAPVGVCFGPPGTPPGTPLPDPFFGGAGPGRRACCHCGECMTGCRHGAKNTLLTNYLYLAEKAGAQVFPMSTVAHIAPGVDAGWKVTVRPTGSGRRDRARVMEVAQVVLAAGTWGTQRLLHEMVGRGALPALSPRLGQLTRTNSESLLGAVVPRRRAGGVDFTRGVAITSSFFPEPGTHVEPVRYGRRSNLMGLFGTLLVSPQGWGGAEVTPGRGPGDGTGRPTWGEVARAVARDPVGLVRGLDLRRWSERTVIALVMQARDNSLALSGRKGLFGRYRLASRPGHGAPNPVRLQRGHEAARRLARAIGGYPAGNWGELLGRPLTAHFIGGCPIGPSLERGVLDPWHRVYNYEGLHIVDGSALPANPGANPSLTIAALAERAFAFWPNQGGHDPRPPLTTVAAALAGRHPVPPLRPVVPEGAPGELRFTAPARPADPR